MESVITMLVAAFIGVAIMFAVGVNILSGVGEGIECHGMDGYNGTTVADQSDITKYTEGSWGHACLETQQSTQSAFQLMFVILTVVAAVVILIVVRML